METKILNNNYYTYQSKRKFLINPVKIHNMKETEEEIKIKITKSITKIKFLLDSILNNTHSNLSFFEYYQYIYNLLKHNNSDKLITIIKTFLNEHSKELDTQRMDTIKAIFYRLQQYNFDFDLIQIP